MAFGTGDERVAAAGAVQAPAIAGKARGRHESGPAARAISDGIMASPHIR
jgi:hypothetical protein